MTAPLPHAAWRKSSYSTQEGACVEVANLGAAAGVRDSKDPAGPVLTFRRSATADLVRRIRAGELNI